MRKISTLCLLFPAALVAPVLAGDEEPPGRALYASKCAMCHGQDGVALRLATGSANFNDPAWKKVASSEIIQGVIADGVGTMPSFSDKLSAEEIQSIAEYVKTLGDP